MKLQERLHLEPFIFEGAKAFVQSKDGLEFLWDPEVQGGALGLEFGSDFERRELDSVLSHLANMRGEDIVFIDIGANCGLYSLSVARHFPKSHSYCFEPVPTTLALLSANVQRNGFDDRITVVDSALGDQPKRVRMTASYSAMDHLVVGNGSDELSPLIVDVPMTTVDTFVVEQSLERIDFIKCDVEGAELLVFKGAQKTLTRFHPPILLEIEPRHTKRFGYTPDDLDEFLRSFGYLPSRPSPANKRETLTSLQEGIANGFNNFLYLAQTHQ
jgi:FkbM family methyltransferase